MLDIGTHRGLFSALFNGVLHPQKTVCVEPNNYKNSIITSRLQGYPHVIINTALADTKATKTYYMHSEDSMNSIVESDPDILASNFPFDDQSKMQKQQIETLTLDDLLDTELKGVSDLFIKIDTQGNELNILKAGTNVLSATNAILVEHMFLTPYKTDYTFFDLVSFLKGLGFECSGALHINRRPNYQVSAVDFLFVKQ